MGEKKTLQTNMLLPLFLSKGLLRHGKEKEQHLQEAYVGGGRVGQREGEGAVKTASVVCICAAEH